MKPSRLFLALALLATACAKPPPPAPPPAPPPPPPPPPPLQIDLPGEIEFDPGTATLRDTKGTNDTLEHVAKMIKDEPRLTVVRVEGHTDNDGTEQQNQKLSEGRADAVVRWLTAHGVEHKRLHSVGCGARDPIVPNTTPQNKQRNRRTEFDVEEADGKPLAGGLEPCAPHPSRKK